MSEEELERLEDEFNEIVHSFAYDTALEMDHEELVDNLAALIDRNGFEKCERFLWWLREKYGRSPFEQALDDALAVAMSIPNRNRT